MANEDFEVGQAVTVELDNTCYEGKVYELNADGTYDVQFDDGNHMDVADFHMKARDLPEPTMVYTDGGKKMEAAISKDPPAPMVDVGKMMQEAEEERQRQEQATTAERIQIAEQEMAQEMFRHNMDNYKWKLLAQQEQMRQTQENMQLTPLQQEQARMVMEKLNRVRELVDEQQPLLEAKMAHPGADDPLAAAVTSNSTSHHASAHYSGGGGAHKTFDDVLREHEEREARQQAAQRQWDAQRELRDQATHVGTRTAQVHAQHLQEQNHAPQVTFAQVLALEKEEERQASLIADAKRFQAPSHIGDVLWMEKHEDGVCMEHPGSHSTPYGFGYLGALILDLPWRHPPWNDYDAQLAHQQYLNSHHAHAYEAHAETITTHSKAAVDSVRAKNAAARAGGDQAKGGKASMGQIYEYGERVIWWHNVPVVEQNDGVVINAEFTTPSERYAHQPVFLDDQPIRNKDWWTMGPWMSKASYSDQGHTPEAFADPLSDASAGRSAPGGGNGGGGADEPVRGVKLDAGCDYGQAFDGSAEAHSHSNYAQVIQESGVGQQTVEQSVYQKQNQKAYNRFTREFLSQHEIQEFFEAPQRVEYETIDGGP